jgi:hypothetical protein
MPGVALICRHGSKDSRRGFSWSPRSRNQRYSRRGAAQLCLSAIPRGRAKDLAHDYLQRDITERETNLPVTENLSPQEIQRMAREKWLEFKAGHSVAKSKDKYPNATE